MIAKQTVSLATKRNQPEARGAPMDESRRSVARRLCLTGFIILGLLATTPALMAGGRLPPGRVVFASTPVDDWQSYIYVMKTDGTERMILVSAPFGSLNDPRPSPDGRKVLFTLWGSEVWVMDADGSNPHYLAVGRMGEWSPDGKKIVFNIRNYDYPGYQVYIMDPDGANVTRVTSDTSGNATRGVFQPPNGTRIYFSSTRDGNYNSCLLSSQNQAIYACDLDGGNESRITDPEYLANQVHFAPDGTRFVCTSDKDVACNACEQTFVAELTVFTADGSTSQKITDTSYRHTKPRWRGDGQKFVCQAAEVCDFGERSLYQVWTVNADGSSFTPVTDPTVEIADGPDWTWVYKFSGLLPPIKADGRESFKLGSVIPVKFDIYDPDGKPVNNAVAKLYVQKMLNGPIGSQIAPGSANSPNAGNTFRWVGNHYQFNLDTKASWASPGTWNLDVQLDDGTSYGTIISLR
jgi:Tol biopolymer transport system component